MVMAAAPHGPARLGDDGRVSSSIDYEAEGLLDGLDSDARAARIELLEDLEGAGVEAEELRAAAREGRLALLAVERVLTGSDSYTPDQVAELSGVPRELLDRQWQALGMAVSDDRIQTADDLEAAKRLRTYLDAGLDPDALTEMARVMAMSMSQVAAANRQMVGAVIAAPGNTELDVARGGKALTEALIPMVGPTLEHIFKLQLREQLRHAAVDMEALRGGQIESSERMAIAFVDLVDFTGLGERLAPEELGQVTGRLGQLAGEVARGPVRLVKLIGDAAMLASPDTGALVDATLDLIDAAEAEGEEFPGIRAGIACGPVLPRGGDFYGRTVNLASRVTGVARPGSLLVSAEVREELGDDEYRFSDAGHKRLKGIETAGRLFRLRDLPEDDEDDDGSPDDSEGAEAGADGDGTEVSRTRRSPRRRRARRSARRRP
jgi:adenylate cyclase